MSGKILVTGAGGGIGRYIYELLGSDGIGLTRESDLLSVADCEYRAIIHCARNHTPTRLITNDSMLGYYDDNIRLTERLLKIPHNYFVFFSTVDIYPGGQMPHYEDEIIQADSLRGIYSFTKIVSESLVCSAGGNFLILRPTTLMGCYMRQNNISKLLNDPLPELSLDADSMYNLIHYSDVIDFIVRAIGMKATGIFNLASSENIRLSDIAKICGKKTVFGSHHYEVGNIVSEKAARFSEAFKMTSGDVMKEFIAKMQI